MNAEYAARKLDEKLRPFPWFNSVGVGMTDKGETLFVYVRSMRHRELSEIGKYWMGIPVVIRATGGIRPMLGGIAATAY